MDEFKKELWDYIWDSGVDLRREVKEFYSSLRDSLLEHNDSSILYHMAFSLCCLTKKRLPDHLHSRMILACNEWSKKYIAQIETYEKTSLNDHMFIRN